MEVQKKWLIVMGRKSAKVFSISEDESKVKWLKTLRNPLGGERNRVMQNDRPGSSRGKYSKNVSPHSLTGGKDPHEDVAIEFAKKVGDYVKQNNEEKVFSDLTIAAESHMLGLIKKAFKTEKIKVDVEWLKKDMEKLTSKKIEKIMFHHN
jgi:protein required for attachment to host cells